MSAISVAEFVVGRDADADGYVRLEVGHDAWTGLAEGCAAGLQELSALWADGDRVRMALNAEGRRAIVSLETQAGLYPSVAAVHAPAMRLERAMRDLGSAGVVGVYDHASADAVDKALGNA